MTQERTTVPGPEAPRAPAVDGGNGRGPAAPTSEEWRVTVKGPQLEVVRLERLAATAEIQGDVKDFVVTLDPATGAYTNIEVLDGQTRRPLSDAEYTHIASVYMAAYMSAAYGQPADPAAEYWRMYFGYADPASLGSGPTSW